MSKNPSVRLLLGRAGSSSLVAASIPIGTQSTHLRLRRKPIPNNPTEGEEEEEEEGEREKITEKRECKPGYGAEWGMSDNAKTPH